MHDSLQLFSIYFIMLLFMQTKVSIGYFRPRNALFRGFTRGLTIHRAQTNIGWKPEGSKTLSQTPTTKPLTNTNYKIIKYPDPRLRTENEIVTQFDGTLQQLTSSMLKLMYQEDGVGLAAPQIGINKRIMVFNEEGKPTAKEKEMILINPYIISKSTEVISYKEGCLSFPAIEGSVERYQWIEVEYQNVVGEKLQKRFEGFPSIIFQHEYDHLDKVLFIDRFNPKDKIENSKKLEKLIRKYGPGGVL